MTQAILNMKDATNLFPKNNLKIFRLFYYDILTIFYGNSSIITEVHSSK